MDPASDLIFVSMENWDDIWRRNQFLCAGLARRYPEMKILFAGLARDVSHAVRCGGISELRQGAISVVASLPGITATRPLKLLPNSISIFRLFNEALMRAHVRRAARRLGMSRPLLWLNPHSAVHMVGKMGESGVIYDITDDWISLTQSRSQKRLTAAQDAELCRRADAVIVCSRRLYELKQGMAQHLYLVPNGVDADHYRCVADSEPATSEPVWRRPTLGYTGTIHPDRVDIPLVETILKRFTQGTVVMIGPNLLPQEDQERLRRYNNLVLTGPVPYRNLPQMMRSFDVCITPHLVTPFTESLNPIKLWEYLAAGKPIVATDVAGFRDHPALVRIAHNADDFLCHVQAALCEPPDLCLLRRAEASRCSWETRLDSVVEVIKEVTR